MDSKSPEQIALNTLVQELKREIVPILSVPKRYLNEQEASRYLGGLSIHTLRQWRSRGTGPDYLRVGTRVIYDVRDLNIWMGQCRVRREG